MRSVPDFTLKQLAYLRALVRAGNFGAAALASNITQPALSLQIKTLEDHFGGQLIERRRDGLRLTPLGSAVLDHANAILTVADDLAALAVRAHETPVSPIRLGLIPTVAPYLLPRILPRLSTAFGDLTFAIREGKTSTLIADLEQNAIDAAVVALPLDVSGLVAAQLLEEPFVLATGPHYIAPRSRTNAKTGTVPVKSIAREDVLLLEEGHCLRDQTIQACGINVNRALNQFGATSLSTIIEMVASGYGVTLLPEMALEKEAADARIKLFHLGKPRPKRTLGLAWRNSSPYGAFYTRMAEAMKAGAPA